MKSLKEKLELIKQVGEIRIIKEDVKEAINDWILYVELLSLIASFTDNDYLKKNQNMLCKKYNCEWHELGWDSIFGDWEK